MSVGGALPAVGIGVPIAAAGEDLVLLVFLGFAFDLLAGGFDILARAFDGVAAPQHEERRSNDNRDDGFHCGSPCELPVRGKIEEGHPGGWSRRTQPHTPRPADPGKSGNSAHPCQPRPTSMGPRPASAAARWAGSAAASPRRADAG